MTGPEERVYHYSVMLREILELAEKPLLKERPIIVDCTLGDAGHTIALFRKRASLIIGFDRDPEMLQRSRTRLEGEGIPVVAYKEAGGEVGINAGVIQVNRPFSEAAPFLSAAAIRPDLILLDAGISQHHFLGAGRGFSYTDSAPLDMRLDPLLPESASALIERLDERELADLFYLYGEERYSRRIARAVKAAEGIGSAAELAAIVKRAQPPRYGAGIHPATRVFQALRIAVNHELDELERAIAELPDLLAEGGRFLVISFHSLEDRIAKRGFQRISIRRGRRFRYNEGEVRPTFWNLTPSPLQPAPEEIHENPASRSAKLRGIEKMAEDEINEME